MKKKILFFTTSGDYNGGGVMCLIETLRYIDRSKIEPFVVIPTRGTTEDKLKELKIEYSIIRCYDWLFAEKVLNSLTFKLKCPIRLIMNFIAEFRFFYLFKKKEIDGFHLNSVYSNCGVKAAKLLNIPIYWHLREFVDENPWTSVFHNEKKSYLEMSKSHSLIAVSDCVKDFYQAKMPNAKIEVVYDGIDFSSLKTIRKNLVLNKPLRLSMIGGVTEVKGHMDAICAIAELSKEMQCHLSIYGRIRDKAYKDQLVAAINRLGVSNIVSFEGNKTNIQEVWDNTDITLVCSKSESFGRVAVESMFQNIPVIGADNSGTLELLSQIDVLGCLYKSGDAHDLAIKIKEFVTLNIDENIMFTNHNNALRYSSEKNAEKMCDLFLKN